MKKKHIILISAFALLAIGIFIYKNKKEVNNISLTKQEAIDFIFNSGKHASKSFLNTLDENFLITWANSIKVNQSIFNYNNNNYYSQGGKRIS